MAFIVGVGVIDKGRAAVPQCPVVNELDLSRLEIEIDREIIIVEKIQHRSDRRLSLPVDRLSFKGIAAVDLVHAEARAEVSSVLENGRREDRIFARVVLALAVEPERPIEPFQLVSIAGEQCIVDGVEADDAAMTAALRLTQTEEADIIGRRVVMALSL